ncbi:MAG: hypothetical protein ERJ67_02145 [Aphanocapsa feldmannii 277cV]|uniref:Uncharacterized protein n=2 Tax=Aphanocapsa feldmannii TaxID=192050 RepID=A0A524RQ81_9CHRO|nr:MAG: hypothetical protein ERJ67_02145 [Aphanocapsa feldmannii 277cV]TGH20942.1 MAG: hypothetical protein ERJ68_06230 [Aphanocapsa feldmannii 277cI]
MGRTTALLLVAASLAGQGAWAACERSHRVDRSDSPCLDASITNRWNKNGATAKNLCSDYGTMVVKVDRVRAPDWTWHLKNDKRRSRNFWGTRIRSVSCCSDLSTDGICTMERP